MGVTCLLLDGVFNASGPAIYRRQQSSSALPTQGSASGFNISEAGNLLDL
jgi:hypothetical protein